MKTKRRRAAEPSVEGRKEREIVISYIHIVNKKKLVFSEVDIMKP